MTAGLDLGSVMYEVTRNFNTDRLFRRDETNYARLTLYDAIVARERVSERNEMSTELDEFLQSIKIISDEQR